MAANKERRTTGLSLLNTVRVKIFLLRVGVGVAMSITIGIACFYTIKKYIFQEQEKSLAQDALLIQDALLHHLDEQRERILQIAHSEQLKKYAASGREELLERYFKESGGDFTCLAYVDEKGLEEVKVCRGEPSNRLEDISQGPNYIKANQQPEEIIVSQPIFVEDQGEFALVYDHLDVDFFDQRTGYIRATTTLAMFDEFVNTIRVKMSGSAYVISDSGLIVRSPLSTDLGLSAADPAHYFHPIFAIAKNTKESGGIVSMLGRDYKFALTTFAEMGWKVFVIADITELEKPVAKIRNFIFAISVLILVLGELLSRAIGLRITEPIAKLNALALSVVHSGRLSDRVDWQSMDELGDLATSINLMLSRLETSQAALIEEKQFVENILSSMVGCLATVSEQGGIIRVNYELLELFGYHEDEIIGLHYQSLFPARSQPLNGPEKFNFVDREVCRFEETWIVTRGGEEIPVNCTISAINDAEGMPRGLLFIINDIREKKRLEDQRLAVEKKLRATQEDLLKTEKMAVVGQMSGMVAHEVLNPISAVSVRVDLSIKKAVEIAKIIDVLVKIVTDWQVQAGQGTFAEYFAAAGPHDLALLEKIAKNLGTRQAERLEDFQFIERQVHRVIKIIDNLREMSRTEKTVEKVQLVTIMDEVLNDMGDGLAKRQILVEKEYRLASEVKADYMEIYSIFSNLIKNAMQAIDKHREAVERVIRISIDRTQEGKACVAISDSGIGMDEVAKAAIFTPGFTSKGRDGTGIGTSFSRKLARNYGGDIILVDSAPGKGATFHVLLAIAGEKINDRDD